MTVSANQFINNGRESASIIIPIYDPAAPSNIIGTEETVYGNGVWRTLVKIRTFQYKEVIVYMYLGDKFEPVIRATDDPDSADYETIINGKRGKDGEIGDIIDDCRRSIFIMP